SFGCIDAGSPRKLSVGGASEPNSVRRATAWVLSRPGARRRPSIGVDGSRERDREGLLREAVRQVVLRERDVEDRGLGAGVGQLERVGLPDLILDGGLAIPRHLEDDPARALALCRHRREAGEVCERITLVLVVREDVV